MLNATPWLPNVWPVNAAPTVPEWMIDVPVLSPAFGSDTTTSGLSPNAPSAAAITASPGGPSTAYASIPSRSTRRSGAEACLQSTDARPGTADVLGGRGDHDVMIRREGPGEIGQTRRVDAVVVGQQHAMPPLTFATTRGIRPRRLVDVIDLDLGRVVTFVHRSPPPSSPTCPTAHPTNLEIGGHGQEGCCSEKSVPARHDQGGRGNTAGMTMWRKPSLRRPATSAVVGLTLAAATVALDGVLPVGWLFGWRPPADGARALLGAVTGSIITVSALVFWVRGMFVQLSAGQLSSRVLRWYLADRYQQHVLDFLVGVFGYTAAVTLTIGDAPSAPTLSTTVAVALSLAALVVVVVTITDTARATELTEIMAQIARRTSEAVRRTHPAPGQGISRRAGADDADGPAAVRVVHAPAAGWVGAINDDTLLATLPAGATMRLWTRAGSFVLRDTVIADVSGVGDRDLSALVDAIRVSGTREVANDVELGMRNLVDIALQALAMGTRDATSAYEAIHYLASVVHEILLRDLPNDARAADGRRIVRMAELGYDDYVDLAFDQIRQSGAGYPAIASVLLTALHMLRDAVKQADLPQRADPLQRQIDLVLRHVERTELAAPDRDKIRRHTTALSDRWLHPGDGPELRDTT